MSGNLTHTLIYQPPHQLFENANNATHAQSPIRNLQRSVPASNEARFSYIHEFVHISNLNSRM